MSIPPFPPLFFFFFEGCRRCRGGWDFSPPPLTPGGYSDVSGSRCAQPGFGWMGGGEGDRDEG